MQDIYGISSRRITGSPPGAPTYMDSLRDRESLRVWSPYVYGFPTCMVSLCVWSSYVSGSPCSFIYTHAAVLPATNTASWSYHC